MKQLFLLPFAGGTSFVYSEWEITGVSVCPIDYSGHGLRFQEKLIQNEEEMVDDLVHQICGKICGDYYLFGHSMGGLMAWEVMCKMKKEGIKLPQHLFISACEPPDCIDFEKYTKLLNREAIIQYLRLFKRVPVKRLQSKTFTELIEPAILHDFRILADHKANTFEKTSIPITVFFSQTDQLMRFEKMKQWENYSEQTEFVHLEGNHFYIENSTVVTKILKNVERVVYELH